MPPSNLMRHEFLFLLLLHNWIFGLVSPTTHKRRMVQARSKVSRSHCDGTRTVITSFGMWRLSTTISMYLFNLIITQYGIQNNCRDWTLQLWTALDGWVWWSVWSALPESAEIINWYEAIMSQCLNMTRVSPHHKCWLLYPRSLSHILPLLSAPRPCVTEWCTVFLLGATSLSLGSRDTYLETC